MYLEASEFKFILFLFLNWLITNRIICVLK